MRTIWAARTAIARRAGLFLAAVALALGLCGRTDPAAAQGAVRQVFGEWRLRCETPPGAQSEQCALTAQVEDKDRSDAVLGILVFKTADRKASLIRIVAPPHVLLSAQLGLRVDNVDLGHIPFQHCLPKGCIADSPMDERVIKQMRTGQTAMFSVYFSPEEGIGFPVALKGFSEGFDKLP
jgi:invasion protein IalB